MRLYSTKGQSPEVSFKEAIFKGLPDDNGLFMPKTFPKLDKTFIDTLSEKSFQDISFAIAKVLIGDEINDKDLRAIIEDAINFDAPVINIHDNIYALELFHGPTLAFKDFGGRFMSRVMSHFLQNEDKEINILVATSGDTGSAVAQGFFKVPGIKVTILYPKGKVSEIQEKQLTTNGANITAIEVDGTFDDCQRMVKQAFLDQELNKKMNLSSANSINISRLIPQSFYYAYAYAQLVKTGKPLVFCVPSGNFGNLCGGLIANTLGLPVESFVAATNANKIVPDYLETGVFTPKPSVMTLANAMDVGNPSNFPRITEFFGNEYKEVKSTIYGAHYDDTQTLATMKTVFDTHRYELCPHSAIGYRAITEFLGDRKDVNGVFLATAHPVKFIDTFKEATGKDIPVPQRLKEIIERPKQAHLIENDYDQLRALLLR